MLKHRTTTLATLAALGASMMALAQNAPSTSATDANAPASEPQTSTKSDGASYNNSAPSSDSARMQDPKLASCISSEKAKNSGLSDNQIKQKCMLKIGSHQGTGQGQQ